MTDPGSNAPGREAMEELLERGMHYAFSLTHDGTDAQEVLQEACLAVVQAGGVWTRGYLFSAIRARFLDRCRRRKALTIELMEDLENLRASEVSDVLGDGDLFEADHESLHQALAALSPQQREALYLAAVEGMTAQEIADLTGRPRGTVLSLIHRARHKVRALLGSPRAKGGAST